MNSTPAVYFSHMGIFVSDIARMERFYTEFLGLVASDSGNLGTVRMVFLSRDPTDHHQIVLVEGRPPDARFSVINQISLRVEHLAALRHFHANADAHGATDVQAVTHGNALSVYFRDPEGNRVEVFIDTPWYVQQPCRQPIDLSLPDEDLWRWVEAHARSLPGFQPVSDWRQQFQTRVTQKS
jgi:catechol 2,3-dioxygenase-like lactoylglutathione lyase family enzyme